ncbi:MAG: OprO/OprP family phosphate-selective porin [Bacteroidales bacterium]|nr:OprO/OprP family phosphate-selective porin [Bacteroidales bacterium]
MKRTIYKTLTFVGLIILFLASNDVFSQDGNVVTGKVFPAGMLTPMHDVAVQIEGNDATLTSTDGSGFFRMVIPSFPVTLVFNIENYQEQKVTVKRASDITVYLSAGEIEKNDYGQDVGIRVALNPESRDGILMFSSTDKRFKYWFDNRVYFDGAAYFGDNTYQGIKHEIGNGVNIRRMRFAMKAIIYGNWGGEIDFDFGNNAVDIKDAYIRYIGKNWQVKAGQFREPFSIETMTTSRYLTFIERPYAAEQAPSRSLGVDYKVFSNHLYLEGGLFSSTVANDLMRDQNKSKGTNSGWSVTSRLAWAPIKKDKEVLHFGISGSYRTPKLPEIGDPENSFRYAENAETEINRKKYIDSDWVSNCDHKTALGLEAAYAFKNIRFQGEYIRADITRDADKVPDGEDKYEQSGFYVQGSWLINNGDYYYNMTDAEFSQIDFREMNKGVFEVALRYSYMNANTFKDGEDIPFIPGGAGETYTIGINYHVNYNVKFMLNYAYLNHDRWADGKGSYITDEADPLPSGEAGIDFSTIQARVLIAF